jgi:hypothetical protein
MASSHPVEAVLHCRKDQPNNVFQLAMRLLKGLYTHSGTFINPSVSKVNFETETGKLSQLIVGAKGNHSVKLLRDAKAIEVFGLCKELLIYVKPICKENVELINLSGFNINRQPVKILVPLEPSISKIVKTGTLNTYRIILLKKQSSELVDKDPQTHPRNVRYTVELTLTPEDPESWTEVCSGKPRNKLSFSKVFPGQKNHVRVYGNNSAGDGPRSLITYFTPEIF